MAEVGTAVVKVVPSMDGFGPKLTSGMKSAYSKANSAAESAGEEAGSKFSNKFSSFMSSAGSAIATGVKAGAAVATAAIVAVGTAALNSYADYEQLVGGVDTLFGDASGTIQKYAAEAYKTSGMSANQYMTQATSFAASLVSSLGGDTAAAAEYANKAMGDMSDNVNKMGSDMQDVQNAYQGFAKQNYTMLDNLKLGYGGTKAEMERLIEDANKLKEAQGQAADLSIDSYADVVEAIHTVQENMGITGTTALEAATTIQGSMAMAKSAWENFLTGLANEDADLSQLTTQLLEAIGAVAQNVAPRVAQIGQGIIDAFPIVLQGLGDTLAPLLTTALQSAWEIATAALSAIGLGPFIENIVSTLGPALEALGAVLQPLATSFIGLWESIQPVVNALGNILVAALTIATYAITTAGVVITLLASIFTALFNTVAEVFNSIPSVVDAGLSAAQGFISGAIATIKSVWSAGWSAVTSFLNSAWSNIKSGVSNGISGVVSFMSSVPSRILGALGNVGSLLYNAGASIINGLLNGIKNAISGVYDFVSGIAGTIASLKGPLSYDRVLLTPAGEAIVGGLYNGIANSIGSVYGLVSGVAGNIADTMSGDIDASISGTGSFVRGSSSSMSGGKVININQQNKIVRSDADLYSAATIINNNALRLAGA